MSDYLKKEKNSDSRINLLLEESKFINQYTIATTELLNSNNNIKIIYPIVNLIHQTLELELKSLIVDNHIDYKTYCDLGISNEHNLVELIKHDRIKKYYEGIVEIECEFTALNKCIVYFSQLLGDNTFQKSRYAIEKKQNIISKRKPIDFEELKKQWTIYSVLSVKLHLIHMAYYIVNDMPLLLNDRNIYKVCEKVVIDEIPNWGKRDFEQYINLYKQRKKV